MMTNSSILRAGKVALVSAAALVSLAASSRADFDYTVTLNVASLVGNGNGPFSLDLQFVPGAGTAVSSNTVTISNFVFTGGSVGAANFTSGDETGSESGTVVLGAAGNFDNELSQAFGAGVTQISFNVDETTNAVGNIPDQFNVAILDNTLGNIPTSDPSTANEILSSPINGTASISKFTSNAPDAGVSVTTAAVPEPGSVSMLVMGALGLLGFKRFRSAKLA